VNSRKYGRWKIEKSMPSLARLLLLFETPPLMRGKRRLREPNRLARLFRAIPTDSVDSSTLHYLSNGLLSYDNKVTRKWPSPDQS
jgi:hypothetical protein